MTGETDETGKRSLGVREKRHGIVVSRNRREASEMALFERALGEDWQDLHPQIRDRYGLVAGEDRIAVGTGEMAELSNHPLARPVLWLGTVEDFLFAEQGTDVPFSITTEAFVDDQGYEALFLKREFETDPPRKFVDTLRWNPERECITDLFGRNGRVAADLSLGVDDGELTLTLGTQWLRVGGRYLWLPGPLAVDATLRDWYDDDAEKFNVAADIENPLLGRVFRYRGRFENDFETVDAAASTESALGAVGLPGARR